MGWLDPYRGKLVSFDTAPLIYFIEEHAMFLPLVRPLFEAVQSSEIRLVTSSITLVEVLVQPIRRGRLELAEQYRDVLMNTEGVQLVSLSEQIAEYAAILRAQYRLRTPDAIQLATAKMSGAAAFITNDEQFAKTDFNVIILNQPPVY